MQWSVHQMGIFNSENYLWLEMLVLFQFECIDELAKFCIWNQKNPNMKRQFCKKASLTEKVSRCEIPQMKKKQLVKHQFKGICKGGFILFFR